MSEIDFSKMSDEELDAYLNSSGRLLNQQQPPGDMEQPSIQPDTGDFTRPSPFVDTQAPSVTDVENTDLESLQLFQKTRNNTSYIKNQAHPELSSSGARYFINNFLSHDPKASLEFLRARYPTSKGYNFALYGGDIVVKGPRDKEFSKLDPTFSFFSPETWSNWTDLHRDVLDEAAQSGVDTLSAATAGLAGGLTGGIGGFGMTVLGGGAGAYAGESLRQRLAQYLTSKQPEAKEMGPVGLSDPAKYFSAAIGGISSGVFGGSEGLAESASKRMGLRKLDESVASYSPSIKSSIVNHFADPENRLKYAKMFSNLPEKYLKLIPKYDTYLDNLKTEEDVVANFSRKFAQNKSVLEAEQRQTGELLASNRAAFTYVEGQPISMDASKLEDEVNREADAFIRRELGKDPMKFDPEDLTYSEAGGLYAVEKVVGKGTYIFNENQAHKAKLKKDTTVVDYLTPVEWVRHAVFGDKKLSSLPMSEAIVAYQKLHEMAGTKQRVGEFLNLGPGSLQKLSDRDDVILKLSAIKLADSFKKILDPNLTPQIRELTERYATLSQASRDLDFVTDLDGAFSILSRYDRPDASVKRDAFRKVDNIAGTTFNDLGEETTFLRLFHPDMGKNRPGSTVASKELDITNKLSTYLKVAGTLLGASYVDSSPFVGALAVGLAGQESGKRLGRDIAGNEIARALMTNNFKKYAADRLTGVPGVGTVIKAKRMILPSSTSKEAYAKARALRMRTAPLLALPSWLKAETVRTVVPENLFEESNIGFQEDSVYDY